MEANTEAAFSSNCCFHFESWSSLRLWHRHSSAWELSPLSASRTTSDLKLGGEGSSFSFRHRRLLSSRLLVYHNLGLESGPNFRWQYSFWHFSYGRDSYLNGPVDLMRRFPKIREIRIIRDNPRFRWKNNISLRAHPTVLPFDKILMHLHTFTLHKLTVYATMDSMGNIQVGLKVCMEGKNCPKFFRVAFCAKMPKKHGSPDIARTFSVCNFSILL